MNELPFCISPFCSDEYRKGSLTVYIILGNRYIACPTVARHTQFNSAVRPLACLIALNLERSCLSITHEYGVHTLHSLFPASPASVSIGSLCLAPSLLCLVLMFPNYDNAARLPQFCSAQHLCKARSSPPTDNLLSASATMCPIRLREPRI